LKRDRWLFLFAAISAVCALATFCKIDVLTVTNLFGAAAHDNSPLLTFRDGIIILFIVVSFLLSGLGFYLNRGGSVQHITRNQKRIFLDEAGKLKTLISSILIAFTDGDPATEQLAHDFGQVFTRAGIAPWFVYTRPDNPSQSGVILCIKDLNNPHLATEDLKNALRSANIRFEVSRFPRCGFGGSNPPDGVDENLVLWVAPQAL
jgi:hypothetical protein